MDLPDSGALINEFINTHPAFMSGWPLKNRMTMRHLCDQRQVKEFFDEFLAWYDGDPDAVVMPRWVFNLLVEKDLPNRIYYTDEEYKIRQKAHDIVESIMMQKIKKNDMGG